MLTGLSCGGGDIQAPTTGSIRLTMATSGPDPDADGYAVAIDEGPETAIAGDDTLQLHNIQAGDHGVRVTRITAARSTHPRCGRFGAPGSLGSGSKALAVKSGRS